MNRHHLAVGQEGERLRDHAREIVENANAAMSVVTEEVSHGIAILIRDRLADFIIAKHVVNRLGDVAVGIERGFTNRLCVARVVPAAGQELRS